LARALARRSGFFRTLFFSRKKNVRKESFVAIEDSADAWLEHKRLRMIPGGALGIDYNPKTS
jgi:hypothetical protein